MNNCAINGVKIGSFPGKSHSVPAFLCFLLPSFRSLPRVTMVSLSLSLPCFFSSFPQPVTYFYPGDLMATRQIANMLIHRVLLLGPVLKNAGGMCRKVYRQSGYEKII